MAAFVLLIIYLCFYFAPAMIAFAREHENRVSILLLNIFLAWTGVGWVVALIWCFTRNTKSANSVVVSNHVFVQGPGSAFAAASNMDPAATAHDSRVPMVLDQNEVRTNDVAPAYSYAPAAPAPVQQVAFGKRRSLN